MIEGHRTPCDVGVIHTNAEPAPCRERDRHWVLAATILGSSLAFITGSVVNVALPAIQQGLGASAVQMQWILNSYLLFLGALILTGGSLGDHFGRKRIFVLGTLLFTGAAVWCGLATSAEMLILARGVQGIGGALLVPSSLAIISATFQKETRGKAIGTWAGFSALTTAFGPVLGGWLVDLGNWRWVFFVVIPFALLCVAITLWRMPETREANPGALDGRGTLLATVGLGTLTYGLITSSEAGWSDPAVLASLLAGVVILAEFVTWESRSRNPMMPLRLFRSRLFSGANLITLFLYFALSGTFFFLPFNLIQVQGYSATAAGAAFLPFTLLMGLFSRWAGSLTERYGARKPLIVGPLVVAIGLVLLMLPGPASSYWTGFFPGLLVFGIGMTVSVAPLTTVAMNAVDEEEAGVASGVNNAVARIAGLLAIAILGVAALSVFSGVLETQLVAADVPSGLEDTVWNDRRNLAAIEIPTEVGDEIRMILQQAIDTSFIASFRWVVGIGAALAFAGAVCAALMIRPGTTATSESTNA